MLKCSRVPKKPSGGTNLHIFEQFNPLNFSVTLSKCVYLGQRELKNAV